MDNDPFASRLAERLKWPIALTGAAAVLIATADLLSWVPDRVTAYTAAAVGVGAGIMLLCAALDMRLQRAVSALNAERRREAQGRSWLSRLPGLVRLRGVDRDLFAVGFALLLVISVAANVSPRGPAAALAFAGFFLICVAQIALMARGYPTDRFVPPFD